MLNFGDLSAIQEPLLFKNLCDWDLVKWSIDDWRHVLGANDVYPVRKGRFLCSEAPQWERSCKVDNLTGKQFFDHFKDTANTSDWLYFDYKHISEWRSKLKSLVSPSGLKKNDTCKRLQNFSWECVGYPEKTAEDSTLWMGTKGAHTCCHIDTYGCNFVAQLHGRKSWMLLPSTEMDSMRPTRVPYEESSIYSSVNFACGCGEFPDVKDIRMLVLEPGDILFVPHHWWHYVENDTSAISVNIWIPHAFDDRERLKESLVKSTIISFVKGLSQDKAVQILNPNEDDVLSFSHSIDELAWCIRHIDKDEPQATSPPVQNVDLSSRVVPRTSIDLVRAYLKRKCERNWDKKEGNEKMSVEASMINAFCHPEVINLVYSKLHVEL